MCVRGGNKKGPTTRNKSPRVFILKSAFAQIRYHSIINDRMQRIIFGTLQSRLKKLLSTSRALKE